MLTTLAYTVFIVSILVFFSDELRQIVIRTSKNYKFQVLAPLFLLSWIAVFHDWIVLMLAILWRIGVYMMVFGLAKLSPLALGPKLLIPRIITLFSMSVPLLFLSDVIGMWIKTPKHLRYICLLVSAFVWGISASMMIPQFEHLIL